MNLNPYLKAIAPGVLTLLASLGTVYGNLPWWTPVATAIAWFFTYIVPNIPKTNSQPWVPTQFKDSTAPPGWQFADGNFAPGNFGGRGTDDTGYVRYDS